MTDSPPPASLGADFPTFRQILEDWTRHSSPWWGVLDGKGRPVALFRHPGAASWWAKVGGTFGGGGDMAVAPCTTVAVIVQPCGLRFDQIDPIDPAGEAAAAGGP